jgi:hypothetical protein
VSIRLGLVNQLPEVLARAGRTITAPPRRRGPGPRPVVSFKYQLRSRGCPPPIASAPAGDNLVSVRHGRASAMSRTSVIDNGSGAGEEPTVTLQDLAHRLAAIEEIIRPLAPLEDQVLVL